MTWKIRRNRNISTQYDQDIETRLEGDYDSLDEALAMLDRSTVLGVSEAYQTIDLPDGSVWIYAPTSSGEDIEADIEGYSVLATLTENLD
jgi:hypothetical protein